VGEKYVADEDYARWAIYSDLGINLLSPDVYKFTKLPGIIVKPQSTEEVVAIVKLANRTRTPIVPRGMGEAGAASALPAEAGSIVLDLGRMNRIIEINEVTMSLTAEAGCTIGQIRHELAKKGYRPGNLGSHGPWGSTLGGQVGNHTSGTAATKYGQMNEDVLTLKVVLPTGEVIETGGQINQDSPVHHRYCNGPDLAGLFMGAAGTLGIVTEVTIRIYPKQEFIAHATYAFSDGNACYRALHELAMMGYVEDLAGLVGPYTTMLLYPKYEPWMQSLYGIVTQTYTKEELEAQVKKWDEVAVKYGGKNLEDPGWADVNASDYEGAVFAPWLHGLTYTCHVWPLLETMKRADELMALMAEYDPYLEVIPGTDLRVRMLTQLGGIRAPYAFFTSFFKINPADPVAQQKSHELRRRLFELEADKGACGYRQGKTDHRIALLKRASPDYTKVLVEIKKALDPNNIMNPGGLVNI
jgi:FAD/FMN-containing dehydrogenase